MDKNREKEFADDIDRLLAGEKISPGEQPDDDYRSNIDFAGRMIECRSEPPEAYREDLKKRLLSKLSEAEEARIQNSATFWERLKDLFPQNSAWRLTAVQFTVAVLTLVLIWWIESLFANQGPILTWPPGGHTILEMLFFTLGLANSLLLIFIFIIRRNRLDLVQKTGWVYLLLAVPAAWGIFLVLKDHQTMQYVVFLGIFLAYLLLEWLYDYVLKINFRENFRQNWKWLTPYLCLYYAMNYGFVVMSWKISTGWGLVMLSLFIIQLTTNLISHPKRKG
jgi:hypothetical protein